MEINKYKHIYFIGIGGIGMSALARYCLNNEIAVYGYDKTRTALCVALEEEGAQIIYKEEAFLVPELFKDLQNSLVIYTPAISASNSISQTLKLWGHNLTKRAAFLGSLSESFYTIAVAGTHGKTTTSCLLAHLFKEAKMDFTAILGGISTNLNSNYYCQKGRKITGKSILITEADEFDVEVNPKDIRKDLYCASGPGGQSVNTTYSAVRLTHIPTGIVAQCQDQKSQHKNYDKALKVLRSRIYEIELQKRLEELSGKRKSMVVTGDRSAKIRTYNYPQGRVTDHRIGLTQYNLSNVMDGDIEKFIEELKLAENAERLKEGTTQTD